MEEIKKAIEEFIQKRLAVYRADPQQIIRDTHAAGRAAKDQTGRWLFELLQNCDDAGASQVQVLINGDTVYVADNGHGLKADAVSAICGTDFSDKTSGTIGRKGLGFKSVYEVSHNPQVLTVNGEGIEFSQDKAKVWLRQNGLNDEYVPYQWIPFFFSWEDALGEDPALDSFANYKTVVKLASIGNMQSIKQLLQGWPPHSLFAFRHVRWINAPNLKITLSPGNGTWEMNDSRIESATLWHVSKHTEKAPQEHLERLEADERQAILADGVSFLIAAPIENDRVSPTKDYLPIHVFYPTEQKGPVRLLLHAEFLVKSDRTALIPIHASPFNEWVADRLIQYISEFVNAAYRADKPSSHAALIVPFGERASHPVAADLWQRIADKAKAALRFADVNGHQRLSVDEARLISVSDRLDQARSILEATDVRKQLLHCTFDEDKEARKALKELDCGEIHDLDLMKAIAENADSLAADTQWIWECWEWLADWVLKEPYGDKHRERIVQVRDLPLVPVEGRMFRPSDLDGRIVTWKQDGQEESLPDWLPLTFVEGWFRDRIQAVTKQEPPVKKLCAELGIEEPGEDVIQRAVGQAIVQYWKDKQVDPQRFLHFILLQDWHETVEASSELKRCPVPLSQPVQGETWAEAGKGYFGREWGNNLLIDLYDGIATVAWVRNDGKEDTKERRCQVLEWLGVAHCPRIVVEGDYSYVWQLPEDCKAWKQYLEKAKDFCGRRVEQIVSVGRLDHLDIVSLDQRRAVSLICLLARHWETCFSEYAEVTARGTQGRERYNRYWQVKAKWWWAVCERLVLPKRDKGAKHVALISLWVPVKRTERAIGNLLPIIDLEVFANDKDTVLEWLINVAGIRTRIEQLTVEEWKELLYIRIPGKVSVERLVSDELLQDRVTGWYAACLETVAEKEDVSEKVFAACPLLCRKSDEWRYVADEPRYLDDDNALAKAFAGDVWLFHAPARLSADAVKYLGVLSLAKTVEDQVTLGEPKILLSNGLLARFKESLPYVWAWRSSQSKQDAEKLSTSLKRLKVYVVPTLKANLTLDGVHHDIERRWHETGDTIFLHGDHANETELAQALARALDVRSEADFYENLLRFSDDRQRLEKLLSKGIAVDEVKRCLREYSRPPHEYEAERGAGKTTQHSPSEPNIEAQSPKADLDKKTSKMPEEPLGVSKQPFSLKDSRTVDYLIGMPPQLMPEIGSGGSDGGSHEGHSLTDKEKTELEEAGRRVAARELKKLGFSVEDMPPDNPGFDLRAKKGNEELRVEVKAHKGRATIVDVTQRQYKEYLDQHGYRWELWNVEHLAESDPEPVVITWYAKIPDEALDVRTFRVDLKKCHSPSNAPSTSD